MCASTFSSNKHAEKNNVCNACNFKGRGNLNLTNIMKILTPDHFL